MTAWADRKNLAPIIEYELILASFGGPSSEEAQKFRESMAADEKFQQRAQTLTERWGLKDTRRED